jgi:hypothetical protein
MEGGNPIDDGLGAVECESLDLLTTHYKPLDRLFATTCATSAASALASNIAAKIWATYPQFRAETVRGLIVHSADWTEEMKRQFLPADRDPQKSHYTNLVRFCGYGVPDMERALYSLSNSLTLIVEDEFSAFHKQKGATSYNEMRFHDLPWPSDELLALGPKRVELRATLSYFIEPNPSSRTRTRYRYESHGLRFDFRRPGESMTGFKTRIDAAIEKSEEDEISGTTRADLGWIIGAKARTRGSIHSDIWKGRAADLAQLGAIAVFPTVGWWKTRESLEKFDSIARYSLIVSIRAPEVDVDLYTPIENQIRVPIATTIS